jgi:hypothetical protein
MWILLELYSNIFNEQNINNINFILSRVGSETVLTRNYNNDKNVIKHQRQSE